MEINRGSFEKLLLALPYTRWAILGPVSFPLGMHLVICLYTVCPRGMENLVKQRGNHGLGKVMKFDFFSPTSHEKIREFVLCYYLYAKGHFCAESLHTHKQGTVESALHIRETSV